LIIRFSSFGDILQAQACLATIYKHNPDAKIDWLVRSDFAPLLREQPLQQIHSLQKTKGFIGLVYLLWSLSSKSPYTHIYDAHNNLRSFWVRTLLPLFIFCRHQKWPQTLVRSKNRWKRFLFFKLRRPVFKMPFRGSESFLTPLKKWNMDPTFLQKSHFTISATPLALPEKFIALAPSAAWETKRWPVAYWKKLIELLPQSSFVILGGPQDHFCHEIAQTDPQRILNYAGKLTLEESCAVVQSAQLTISGDTGILHAADQMRVSNIGLIGPTAFGYTSQNTSMILEAQLPCKPCSKDGRNRCTNSIFQKCMVDISPENVAQTASRYLEAR
jgi:heptosyltransferase-2